MKPGGRVRGFTLVELLVALFAMALLAVMSWRGLDAMTRAQAATATRADEVLALQIALAQWSADLDAVVQLPGATALDWNGRVLRMTRRDSANPAGGVLVAAWTLRGGQWLRWLSPPLLTRAQLDQAWLRADLWSQNPGDEERRLEVAVAPLQEWKIFYFRSDAWTNPQSSDAGNPIASLAGLTPAAAAVVALATATPVVPEGVRLVLVLPPGGALAGELNRDWARPTLGGNKP